MRKRTLGPAPGNVPAALDELGIAYVVRGNEATGRCPNPKHDDRMPSWSCNLATGAHNCFACGFGGSFSWLVTCLLRVDPEEAVSWVRKRGGIERARAYFGGPETPAQPLRVYSEADLALFVQPPTWALRERHLTAEAASAFGVLWDQKTDRWILPIRDPYTGKLQGWQEKGDDYFRNRPHGIKKAETLFGYQLLPEEGTAILVESPLDAVRIHAAGIPGAVASFGAALSAAQRGLIRGRCSRLIVAMDDDEAGDQCCAQLRAMTHYFPMRMKYFDYADSGAKDPGEMTDGQIRHGIDHAISSFLISF